jgi:hypothetical protein
VLVFLHRPDAFCKRSHFVPPTGFAQGKIICKPPGTFCSQSAQMVQGVDAMNQSTWDNCVVTVLHTSSRQPQPHPPLWAMLPLAASSRTSTSSPHEVSQGDEVIWPPASGVSKGSSMHAKKPRILMHFTVPMPSDPRRKTLGSQAWLPYG